MAKWMIWDTPVLGIYTRRGHKGFSVEPYAKCSECGEEVNQFISNFMKECPNCHAEITGRVYTRPRLTIKDDDSDKWEYDDDLLSPMYGLYRCPSCGSYSGWPSKFCPECGKKKKV